MLSRQLGRSLACSLLPEQSRKSGASSDGSQPSGMPTAAGDNKLSLGRPTVSSRQLSASKGRASERARVRRLLQASRPFVRSLARRWDRKRRRRRLLGFQEQRTRKLERGICQRWLPGYRATVCPTRCTSGCCCHTAASAQLRRLASCRPIRRLLDRQEQEREKERANKLAPR